MSTAAIALPDHDENARVRIAARSTTPSSVLAALASDPAITVRAAVAMNPTHAPDIDRELLADADERVRALLAAKLANLLPGLSSSDRVGAHEHICRSLNTPRSRRRRPRPRRHRNHPRLHPGRPPRPDRHPRPRQVDHRL